MEAPRFDRLTARFHQLLGTVSRRHLLRGLALGAAAAGGSPRSEVAAAKAVRCRGNGGPCRKAGKRCTAANCLTRRFTVEAIWTADLSDYDTYLFVPNQTGSADPSPYINYRCNPDEGCATSYPFACVNEDASGPGNEVTTVHKVLTGTYEYWIELPLQVPAGELTVRLRRRNGGLVRSWQSPANPANDGRGWHVFDVDGKTGRVTSVGQLIDDRLPDGAHNPSTDVCPA